MGISSDREFLAIARGRWFWGMRLHLCCAPDGTPRTAILAPADQPECEVALRLLPTALRGGEQIVCDKGYAGSPQASGPRCGRLGQQLAWVAQSVLRSVRGLSVESII